ncbi:MAG: hypothetical protein ABI794_06945 [Betaproteobacteria bacterium]
MKRFSSVSSLGLLMLAGCAAAPPAELATQDKTAPPRAATVQRMDTLQGVDFANTDLAQLAAGIDMPRSLVPLPNSARLNVTVKAADGTESVYPVRLVPSSLQEDWDALRHDAGNDRTVVAYRIPPGELGRLEAFRAAMLERAGNARRSPELKLSIGASACRTGDLPEGALPMTSYVRTVETGTFVVLLEGLDLRRFADSSTLAQGIPACTDEFAQSTGPNRERSIVQAY